MIKLMDRLMIRGYFKAYFVCLTSLLSLYVVVDLFTNLDDFVKKGQNLLGVFVHIFTYYSFQLTRIYDRLSEVIVLLAGMFTVAWMQRNNEQLPLLSAGVSTRRIVMPVLFCAAFMLCVTVLNQELLIPVISERLNYDKDDPKGEKEQSVKGQFEPNMIHIVGERAYRKDHMIRKLEVTIPEAVAGHPYHITANEAYFSRIEPRGPNDKYKYKWELIGCHSIPGEIDATWNPEIFQVKDVGRYVLYTREVDFDSLTRNAQWYLLASTGRLYQELQKPDCTNLSLIAVMFQTRLTRPLLGLLLVFMGVSMILRDQNRNIFVSTGGCLALCGVFFVVGFGCKMLGDNQLLSPTLAAWLPVVLFGPFAFVLFDAVHT